MKKYILFIDIDGTLVPNATNKMRKEIIEEFDRIQKDGHIIVVASGRAIKNIFDIEGMEHATYVAALMGNVVVDCKTRNSVKKTEFLCSKTVKKLVDEIDERGLSWTFKDDFEEKTCCENSEVMNKFVCKKVERTDFEQDLKDNKITQLLINGKLPQDFIDRFPEFDFFCMPSDYYDIIKKGFGKAEVVKFFAERNPQHTTVAIGDSNNDIAMLDEAEISIAMGNAKDELKQKCDFVTTDVQNLGVVHAIKNILKI